MLLSMSFLPYEGLKSALGALLADGEFRSLNDGNVLAFRGLFLLVCLLLVWIAYLASGNSPSLKSWLVDRRQEGARLWAALRFGLDKWYIVAALGLLMVLGLAARLPHLWAPLDHDQAYTVMTFASSLRSALTDYHVPNNHVLHTLLVYSSISAFGLKPWAIRLPAVLAGLLLIPATFKLGQAIYDRHTGILAAILVAALPVQVAYTTSARGYPLVALFTVVIFWLGDLVRRDRNETAWFLICLVSALGFWTVPVMLLPFGMLFTWLFMEHWLHGGVYGSRWLFMKHWLVAGFGTLLFTFLLYFPLFVFNGFWKVVTSLYSFQWAELPLMALRHLAVYRGWLSDLPLWLAILLAVGLFLSLLLHSRLSVHRVPMLLSGLAWFALVIVALRPLPWSRVWFFLVAPVAVWCSAGTAGLLKDLRIRPLRNMPASVLLVGVVALYLFSLAGQGLADLSTAPTEVGREEASVLFLQGQLRQGDLVFAPPPQDAPLRYYAQVHGIPEEYFDLDASHKRVFLLTLPVKDQRVQDLVRQYQLIDMDWESDQPIGDFQGLQVFLLERR